MTKNRTGEIIVPKQTIVQPHELIVATILSWTGFKVEFLPVKQTKTADIKFMGKEWEIKSPKGKSSRIIENNMRLALKQSDNIIIDLSRIKLPEQKCITTIRNRAKKLGRSKKVIIITKSKQIIRLYGIM